MKHIPDRAEEPERPRSLEELRCRLNRRLSDFREGWRRCDKPLCRRRTHCCGEGPVFICTDDGRPRRPRSPEEKAKAISDLYKEVKRRRAERPTGAEPTQEQPPSKSRDEPRAVTRRRRRPARAAAATTAAPAPQVHRDEPQTHVAEQTPLAPEKVERIERALNDDVASQSAEQDKAARERRPRITQL
jgi:hypothetical protein